MAGYAYLLYGLGFMTPYVQREFGVPELVAALPNSIAALGLALSGLFAGAIVARVGGRTAGRSWILVMAVAAVALAVRTSLPVVLLAALAFGVSSGGLLVLVNSNLGHGGDRGTDTRLVRANLWAVLGAMIAPLVLATTASMPGVGWAAGMIAPVPLLVGLAIVLPRTPAHDVRPAAGSAAERLPGPYWLAWLFLVFCVGVEFSFVVWGSSVVAVRTGLGVERATSLGSLFVAGMVLSRVVLSSGVGGARSRAILRLCLGLAAAGAAAVWLAPNAVVAGAGLFVGGLGVAAFYPLGVGIALQQAPDAPVRASARLSLASGLAILAVPLLLGLIAQVVGVVSGWPIVFALRAALVILVRLPMRAPGRLPAAATARHLGRAPLTPRRPLPVAPAAQLGQRRRVRAGPAARRARDPDAEPDRRAKHPEVAEVGPAAPVADPPGEESAAERIPGADRVDDLDGRHRYADPPAAVDARTSRGPSVTRTAVGPSARRSDAASSGVRPGTRNSRSSVLALTTSARASTRRSRAR